MTKYNLSQFKKDLKNGRCFKILEHYVRPENNGDIRKVNIMQTNGIYSKNINEDDNSEINRMNGGNGSWLKLNKATYYEFNENHIVIYDDENKKYPLMKIKML